MKKYIILAVLFSATSSFAFPISYCGDEAIKSAEETTDFVENGYVHHKGCRIVKIFASTSPRTAREGTAVIQCKDEKSLVVLVSLKVVKSANEENESCTAETEFVRK